MKKVSVLLCLTLVFFGSLKAQEKQVDIRIVYSNNGNEMVADIIVTMNTGKPDFTFYLMTNDPIRGKVLEESKPQFKNTYTFKNINPDTYFIKVSDSDGTLYGSTVLIKPEN